MEVQERLYTVDDVFEMQGWDGERENRYELIDGELIEMSPTNLLHHWIASEISGEIRVYLKRHDIGFVGVEGMYTYPSDRHTMLAPDVAFVRKDRMPQPMPETYARFMPDLAVEIASPSNTVAELREKAARFLRRETRIVWIVYPSGQYAEVCRLDAEGRLEVDSIDAEGALTGEDLLPGFELPLRALFPSPQA